MQLVLDVPDGDVLPAWAAEAHKKQAASVVFLDANGGRAVETLRLPAAYCVAYHEQFASGDAAGGAYQCFLTLSDPSGWTIAPGGPAGAFVAPAARDHGVPAAAAVAGGLRNMGIGGAMGAALDAHAEAWAAAREQVLGSAHVDSLYAAYQLRKKGKGRDQTAWWNGNNNRGGAKRTVEGGLGEYQADQLFAAQGHTKLNHGGELITLDDPPKGKGLDGVWKNATPPPEYLITEPKYDSAKLSKGQMSDKWVGSQNRLERAVGREESEKIQESMLNGGVEKRLLHIDTNGNMTVSGINAAGEIVASPKPLAV